MLVDYFKAHYPGFSDDIESAFNELSETHKDVSPELFTTIFRRAVLKILVEQRVIRVPVTTYFRHKKLPQMLEINDNDVKTYDEEVIADETLEEIYKIADPKQKEIVTYRLQGLKDEEIAEKMGISWSYVKYLRSMLRDKYNKRI